MQSAKVQSQKQGELPRKGEGIRYPKVGIVDSGVNPGFGDWVLGRAKVIGPHHRNDFHGNFIAGLLIAAREAGNSLNVARELDGCEIVDLDIFPDPMISGAFTSYYPNGFEDFLLELDMAVEAAKRKHGVRVFNLSINVEAQVDESTYSPFAELMDAIAQKRDVLIVVSAGNLSYSNFRGSWPGSPDRVAGHLLPHAGIDRIFQPAESVYAISVGLLTLQMFRIIWKGPQHLTPGADQE